GGTLTAAASALGVSHTTIGRRLRALEGELGVRLFDATPDGFIATAAGHDIAEVAERMESEVLALEGRVVGRDTQLRGKLRVSTMDLLLRRAGAGIASFIERHPSVELSVSTSDTQVSLVRREADVALRITNAPPEDLIGRKVGRIDFALYGSCALVERYGRDPTAPGYPWLHWDERLDGRWLEVWLSEHAPQARVAMRIDLSSLAIHDAVHHGLGVHFLACFDG